MKTFQLTLKLATFALLALLAAPLAWETFTGDYYMTVTGESMEPTYHVGDVLVVQQPAGDELDTVGQIVVVSFNPGDKSAQYVHRVHEITAEGAILLGDGNENPDPNPVTKDQLMGTPRLALTGPAAVAYHLSQNLYARIAVAALFIAAMTIPSIARKRDADDGAVSVSEPDAITADLKVIP